MLSFLTPVKYQIHTPPFLARMTPSRYPPHTAYGLTHATCCQHHPTQQTHSNGKQGETINLECASLKPPINSAQETSQLTVPKCHDRELLVKCNDNNPFPMKHTIAQELHLYSEMPDVSLDIHGER